MWAGSVNTDAGRPGCGCGWTLDAGASVKAWDTLTEVGDICFFCRPAVTCGHCTLFFLPCAHPQGASPRQLSHLIREFFSLALAWRPNPQSASLRAVGWHRGQSPMLSKGSSTCCLSFKIFWGSVRKTAFPEGLYWCVLVCWWPKADRFHFSLSVHLLTVQHSVNISDPQPCLIFLWLYLFELYHIYLFEL